MNLCLVQKRAEVDLLFFIPTFIQKNYTYQLAGIAVMFFSGIKMVTSLLAFGWFIMLYYG